jgi:hypothetical protein
MVQSPEFCGRLQLYWKAIHLASMRRKRKNYEIGQLLPSSSSLRQEKEESCPTATKTIRSGMKRKMVTMFSFLYFIDENVVLISKWSYVSFSDSPRLGLAKFWYNTVTSRNTIGQGESYVLDLSTLLVRKFHLTLHHVLTHLLLGRGPQSDISQIALKKTRHWGTPC